MATTGARKNTLSTNYVNVIVVVGLMIVMMVEDIHMVSAQTSCSTNGGSPTVADANTCVQYVRGLGTSTQCCQLGSSGSCTTMRASGTAAVDICGNNGCTTCDDAGNQLNIILATCPNNNLVAGSRVASGFTFQILHS